MTQQQIADIFNVSQLMVSRWKQQGAPLADHQALCKWLRINRQRMPKKLKDSIQRIERKASTDVIQKTAPAKEADRKTLEGLRKRRRHD